MKNEKCVACASCGFPLRQTTDFAMGDPTSPYCAACVDHLGRLRSYDEILEMNVRYLESNQGIDRQAARHLAATLMADLPAWKDRPRA
jgi:hypothetical protein